jgi:flagellar motility protein MotE (MotC chaperone)
VKLPIVRHLRLLPAVMLMTASLLVIKGEGLVSARAQTGAPPAVVKAQSVKSDPASDDSESGSPAAVDVLTSLAHRRAALDAREQEITTRENLIAAAAKRVDQRIAELKAMQGKLESLLGQRDAAEQKQFDLLVKSYSSMRPKDAARIFDSLSDDVAIPVAAAMKPDILGAMLAQMQPEDAQKLTVKLANRLNMQKIEQQAAQLAATTPPPSMPPAAAGTQAAAAPAANSATPAAAPQPSATPAPVGTAPATTPAAAPATTPPAPSK